MKVCMAAFCYEVIQTFTWIFTCVWISFPKFICVFLLNFWTSVLFMGHCWPCFGPLVTSSLQINIAYILWYTGYTHLTLYICPGFQSQVASLACMLCRDGFLRFTSGVTPANLLAASMAAEPFLSTYFFQALVGVELAQQCAIYRLS